VRARTDHSRSIVVEATSASPGPPSTWRRLHLARMNMILHGYATAQVEQGNTLANPKFLDGDALKTFDYVVANPPGRVSRAEREHEAGAEGGGSRPVPVAPVWAHVGRGAGAGARCAAVVAGGFRGFPEAGAGESASRCGGPA
jgi:hypothetical protein